jgi:RND family efflux transporter MFP subunit
MVLRKSIKALLIIVPFAALIGFTGYRVYQEMKKSDAPATGAPGGQPGGRPGGPGGGGGRAQQVQTGTAATGRIAETISLTGSLRSKQVVDVSPRIAGRLTQVLVDTGYPVAQGALIAVLEDDEIRQQLERSKAALAVVDAQIAQRTAELNNAKIELDRRTQLVESGVLSRNELDTLQMRYAVAQSQLELARAQRRQSEAEQRELSIRQGQTRITAPISGTISRRHVTIGAMVSSATPIVTVVSNSPMIVDAQVSERDVTRIRRGLAVDVTIDSLPGEKFTGRIMRIAPTLDPQTRNGMVEIEIPNRGGALKGEMFARLMLNLGSVRETLLIPRDALIYRGDQPGVFTIEEEKARYIPLETGLTSEDKVEVLKGLKEGDVIVTRGSNLLKDGDRVRVQDANGRANGGAGGGFGTRPGESGGQSNSQGSSGQPGSGGGGAPAGEAPRGEGPKREGRPAATGSGR